MSYLALARKYRPRKFEDVMGQGHVVKALSHALDGDKLHPAILLTGTRGVGKTTLARIIAKCLNCETGVSANPCGVCSACKEVDEGRCVDLLEIDAASNTGVDDVRQVIENAQYAPARGRYKVYLIDEVHMLSKSAFNALLKTLEEPPPHVKFILATTDPQKLLVTVLSRCLQFNLKRLPVSVIRDQLAKVLDDEAVAYEIGALTEIARSADGSMRDGLSLVDQAIAFSGGQGLKREGVEEMLGTTGRQTLFEILAALAGGDADALLACIQRLEEQAPDYGALLNDLAGHLQRIAVLQLLPNARAEDDDAALVELKDRLGREDVQLYYQIAVLGRRDMPWAPDPRMGFEMTLLRMLAFRPGPAPAQNAGSTPQARTAPAGARPASAAPAAAPAAAMARAAAPAVRPVPPPILLRPDAAWDERVEALGLDGFTKPLARNCAWVGRDGSRVSLTLDSRLKHLLQESRRMAIEQALSAQLGEAIQLHIEIATAPVADTPVELDKQRATDRQRAAEAAIDADPVVRAFRDMFGAQVRPGSVQPLDS
ncbi:DNA polymerase III subunit gamma/tau [Solimonas fluminis]|uniref:DNA polymerase III subunit gamma/tau n=1 Tax=Solimonas fluminis TaxID=2086571 RepID=A0A2S5TDB8_9GAMM|nr:DNA polymerase III subunit gamma/tau [Solimonas fluminis]PPE72981.1 DNA polymerase III subunit gamma/tau [Solimonas fluminis]